jgi:hypothetical protein
MQSQSVLRRAAPASRSPKPKRSAAKARPKTRKSQLKASGWYQAAARSIGISYARQSATR